MLVRLHLSADKWDSCLPSLSLYFNIYFAPTDATMFQNIQQFHSGVSNTNSFRLLATLFITKNSIDMRILCSELSQLKRIAIITVNRSGMVRLGGKLQRVRKYMSGNTLYLCHVTNKRYAKERTIFNTQKCNLIQPNYCPKILVFHAVKARKTTRYGERYRS